MSAQPMQAHSLCIAIADKLRERILSHQLPPGSDINDGALAQEFGVSRTPVREAMKLLCHEGLLSAQPRRGMSVTCLSAAQVAEAHLLSSLLAGHLARQRQMQTASTQLCEQLLRVSQARLQLALGTQLAMQPTSQAPMRAPLPAALSQSPHSHSAGNAEASRSALAY
ncbi:GntR family transcriptional regulator [Comamonas thiooxydans]